jgi:hypothetical protein
MLCSSKISHITFMRFPADGDINECSQMAGDPFDFVDQMSVHLLLLGKEIRMKMK